MSRPVHVEQSRTYPVTVEDAFDRLLPLPLPELFASWFGPLPPVRGAEPAGPEPIVPWGTPGQRRRIRLGDGGSMVERLVTVQRPDVFRYEITDFTGALKPLVERVEGSWAVATAGTGAKVTWTWDLFPRGRVGAVAVPLIVKFWPGYARAALARFEAVLLG